MNKWIPMNPYDAPAVEHWLIETAGDEWKLDNIEGDRAYFVPAKGEHWRYRVVPTYPPPPTVPKEWVQVPTFRRVPLTVYETCESCAIGEHPIELGVPYNLMAYVENEEQIKFGALSMYGEGENGMENFAFMILVRCEFD